MTRVDIDSIKPEERRDCKCHHDEIPDLEPSMPPQNVNIRLNEAYDNKDVLKQIALLKTEKQNKLTAGNGVVISNDVISTTPPVWGTITGTLASQTDLNDRFDAIEDDIGNTSDPDTIKGKIAVNTGDIEALESDVDTLETTIVTKQDILIAGTGIEISNNVISADTAFHAQVFNSLPTASELYKNTIALIIISGTQTYKQYACTTEDEGVSWSWKEVGTTQVDLSAYKVWTQTQAYIDSADSLKADATRIPTIVRVGYE